MPELPAPRYNTSSKSSKETRNALTELLDRSVSAVPCLDPGPSRKDLEIGAMRG